MMTPASRSLKEKVTEAKDGPSSITTSISNMESGRRILVAGRRECTYKQVAWMDHAWKREITSSKRHTRGKRERKTIVFDESNDVRVREEKKAFSKMKDRLWRESAKEKMHGKTKI